MTAPEPTFTPINHIAYTAPLNPAGASPILTLPQVWAALQHKVNRAETFVPGAIRHTDILSHTTDQHGRAVTVREVTFREGNRRVRETCVFYPYMKVEFRQPDGSLVMNIVSEGPRGAEEGDLQMTYTFEWLHPEMSQGELAERKGKERAMAKMAVDSTIRVIRDMVRDGRIK
ncbi:DUF1857-domain-containing protein [Trichodelitschia bisporula]|uniref:DUF1857-domain-containing protein n=1 Tax=Trichodelitschia bisporula TaxID=703511 RepID=A0A6G1HM29_9PEZI|nr:DUF1857-domain-containing protein [Trichodelitschia bisporula]